MEFIIDGRKFVLRSEIIGLNKLALTYWIQKDSRHMSWAITLQIFSTQGDEANKIEKEE